MYHRGVLACMDVRQLIVKMRVPLYYRTLEITTYKYLSQAVYQTLQTTKMNL